MEVELTARARIDEIFRDTERARLIAAARRERSQRPSPPSDADDPRSPSAPLFLGARRLASQRQQGAGS